MTDMTFEVKVTATAEVRDKDGNLISAEPIEAVAHLTEAQLAEMGLTPEKERRP